MMNVFPKLLILTLLLGFAVTTPSLASTTQKKEIQFSGLLIDSAGMAVSASGVEIVGRIMAPNSCLLREEIFSGVDLTDGFFTLQLGSGTPTKTDKGFLLKEIFNNTTDRKNLDCLTDSGNWSVGDYTPAERDTRLLILSFEVQGEVIEATFDMGNEGSAMSPEYISGKRVEDLIVVNDDSKVTQANLETLFSQLNLDKIANLGAILAGNYSGNSATATTATTALTANKANQLAVQPTGCEADKFAVGLDTKGNLSCAAVVSGAGGTVTRVSAGPGLTGGNITTTGTLAVDVGTTAGQIVQIQNGDKLPTLDASQLTNLQASQIPPLLVSKFLDFNSQVDERAATASDTRLNVYMAANKNINNGLVGLDSNTKIPASRMPEPLVVAMAQAQQFQISDSITLSPGTVSFVAPATGFTSYSLEMPPTLGAKDQVLALTGVNANVGTLSWTDLSATALPVIPVNKGGTSLTVPGASNQLLSVGASSGALLYKSLVASTGVSLTVSGSNLVLSATGSGGTVASVGGVGPITVSNSTTTPSVSLSSGTSDGQTLRWNDTAKTWNINKIKSHDLIQSTGTTPTWPSISCTSDEVITYNADGFFACTTITPSTFSSTITSAQVVSGLGALALKDNANLNSADTTGILSFDKGGLGLGAIGTANQILGVNGNHTALEYKTLVAGSGVAFSHGDSSLTISATGSGGTVTAVSGVSPLSVAGGTSTNPDISLAPGGITADSTGNILAWNSPSSSVTPNTWSITKLLYTQLTNNLGLSPWPQNTYSAGKAMVWNSSTDNFSYATITPDSFTIPIDKTQVSGVNALALLDSVDLSSPNVTGTMAPARLPAFTGDLSSAAGSNSLTLSSPIPVANGGTGLASTGTNGNVLVSKSNAWVSQVAPVVPSMLNHTTIASASYSITPLSDNHSFFEVTTGGGGATLTLPDATVAPVGFHVVIKAASTSPVLVTTVNSQTIDGVPTQKLPFQNGVISVINTGSTWLIESKTGTVPALLVANPAYINGLDATTSANSVCKNIQITNLGQSTTTTLAITIPNGFAVCSGSCNGQTLAAGVSCTFGVSKQSSTLGTYSGSLTITATSGGTAITYLKGEITN